MTKSQINKLGDTLRTARQVDDESLTRLQAHRALFDVPMTKAQSLLAEQLGVQTTARLKTVNTIVEKLRREKTRLAEMQDIAGLRTVQDIGIGEQDALVSRIVNVFPDAKVVDRRAKPSYGYRAVHVIAKVDGYLVEIQVRTTLQDLWAQAMEKLADQVGRDIRYGGVPASGAESVHGLQQISKSIGIIERAQEDIREMENRRRRRRARG